MDFSHFSIQELGEGVFAALHKEGGAAYSNAGIIDLGGRVLVFDAFESLTAGKELHTAVTHLTGKRATWLANSHKHGDHWGGNQAFSAEAVILSTPLTRLGMLGWGKEMENMKTRPHVIKKEIRDLEKKLENEVDSIQRATLERRLNRNRVQLSDLPEFKFCPPELTFQGKMTFHGSKRDLELVTVGPAHTPEECYLVLPGEKIIFTGDLAFFDSPPFIAEDCSLQGWMEQLGGFIRSEVEVFVPGHGGLGGKANLELEQSYLISMRDMVTEAIGGGKTLEAILSEPLPEPFAAWRFFEARNQNNVRSLFKILSR
jgi:cyclase